MKPTPLQRCAERRARHHTGLDMNLVSLIDIFTILIFFLLSSAAGVEILPASRAVKLPQSIADAAPRPTLVVTVNREDILLDGRKVASASEALRAEGDSIEPLAAALAARAPVQGQALTIMGDRDIPYRLLRKVMTTAARANHDRVSFAVLRKYAT